jgi:signal peptidase II
LPPVTDSQQPATDNRSVRRALFIILLVILVDQAVKIYVKTHFYYQEQVPIFGESQKAFIHFTENNGMAFGMEFGNGEEAQGTNWGKLFLSLFRILAVAGIGWYLWDLIKKGAHKGLIAAIAFVFAGALGNIIDSCFYGLIFSDSEHTSEVAQLFPPGGGYASFLHGKVVDMFYFPLYEGHFPAWFPKWGGEEFTFFSPVFNIADSSITIGVFMIIIFQKRFFGKKKEEKAEQNTPVESSPPPPADATVVNPEVNS